MTAPKSKVASTAGARNVQAARPADDGRTFRFMGQPDHEERFDRCRIYDGTGDTRVPRAVDTDWSDPGETADKPDRYQSRTYLQLHLSAGSNARKPDGSYIVATASTPWAVSEFRGATGTGQDYKPDGWEVVASGTAPDQSTARVAAEEAARTCRAKDSP